MCAAFRKLPVPDAVVDICSRGKLVRGRVRRNVRLSWKMESFDLSDVLRWFAYLHSIILLAYRFGSSIHQFETRLDVRVLSGILRYFQQ